jgi:hypothetical protein
MSGEPEIQISGIEAEAANDEGGGDEPDDKQGGFGVGAHRKRRKKKAGVWEAARRKGLRG